MKVYLLILLVAAAITYVSVPVVRHIALVTHTLTPVRSRDVHKVPVPRLGGVAMYVGMVAAIAVASHIPYLEGVFEGGSAWGVVTPGSLDFGLAGCATGVFPNCGADYRFFRFFHGHDDFCGTYRH